MARCHVGLVMGATLTTLPPSLEFAKLTKLLEVAGYICLHVQIMLGDIDFIADILIPGCVCCCQPPICPACCAQVRQVKFNNFSTKTVDDDPDLGNAV